MPWNVISETVGRCLRSHSGVFRALDNPEKWHICRPDEST